MGPLNERNGRHIECKATLQPAAGQAGFGARSRRACAASSGSAAKAGAGIAACIQQAGGGRQRSGMQV